MENEWSPEWMYLSPGERKQLLENRKKVFQEFMDRKEKGLSTVPKTKEWLRKTKMKFKVVKKPNVRKSKKDPPQSYVKKRVYKFVSTHHHNNE